MSGDQIVVTITEPGMRETEGVLHAIERLNKAMEYHGRREMIVELCNVFGWAQPAHDDFDAWDKALAHVRSLLQYDEDAIGRRTVSMIEDLEGVFGITGYGSSTEDRSRRWTDAITRCRELLLLAQRSSTRAADRTTYALADRVRHVNGNAEPPVEGTIVEIINGPGMAAPEYRVQWDGDPRYTRHAAKYLLPAPAREQTGDELSEPEDDDRCDGDHMGPCTDPKPPTVGEILRQMADVLAEDTNEGAVISHLRSQDTPGVGGTVIADDLDGSGPISTDLIERARTWWFDREEPLARTSPDRPRSPRWPRDPQAPATPPGTPVEALPGAQGDQDHLIAPDQAFAAVQFALQMVDHGAKLDGCEVVARARHALGMDT